MHLRRQVLTWCDISRNLSFVNCYVPAEAGRGAVDKKMAGKLRKKSRAAAVGRPPNGAWCRSVGRRPAAAGGRHNARRHESISSSHTTPHHTKPNHTTQHLEGTVCPRLRSLNVVGRCSHELVSGDPQAPVSPSAPLCLLMRMLLYLCASKEEVLPGRIPS